MMLLSPAIYSARLEVGTVMPRSTAQVTLCAEWNAEDVHTLDVRSRIKPMTGPRKTQDMMMNKHANIGF
ncbi:hypothetical protein ABE142_17365 [Paenibacillus alvei]|uniref:hypothetical protein n=1 Tax=Paenibacillus alvei TaxID=44250 RepID=UPI003D264D24